MYLLTEYIRSVLWIVAVRLSYILDAWCLKVIEHITVCSYLCFSYLFIYFSRFVFHDFSVNGIVLLFCLCFLYSSTT
jgi:hypothetical protein